MNNNDETRLTICNWKVAEDLSKLYAFALTEYIYN